MAPMTASVSVSGNSNPTVRVVLFVAGRLLNVDRVEAGDLRLLGVGRAHDTDAGERLLEDGRQTVIQLRESGARRAQTPVDGAERAGEADPDATTSTVSGHEM